MVRFKNRWLLVELIPCSSSTASALDTAKPASEDSQLNNKEIWSALKQSIITNFGDTGWGAVSTSLTIKYYSPTTNVCIIRVARDQHQIAWAGVTLLSTIEGRKYLPYVVHVSGTIKHTQLAAIVHNREVIARYRANRGQAIAYQDSYEDFLQRSTLELEALQD